jgi:hypothetical protein
MFSDFFFLQGFGKFVFIGDDWLFLDEFDLVFVLVDLNLFGL